MKTKQKTDVSFYQSLGKLFYAIAAADRNVHEQEINVLKYKLKKDWVDVDTVNNRLNKNETIPLDSIFDWLNNEKHNTTAYFKDFLAYQKAHPSMFSKNVKKRILKTARSVAVSFAGINKSELIMLAKLNLALNK